MARTAPSSAVLLACTLLAVAPALADEPPPLRAEEVARLHQRRRLANLERISGWAVAGLGVAGVAAGTLVLTARGPIAFDDGPRYELAGWVLVGAGVVALATGTVLAILGQNAVVEVDWRLKALASLPVVAPVPGGAVVGWALRF